jgi:hypothetical protein
MPYAMRKIRGRDVYKVWNTETGEIKSHESLKKDAKAQIRLLRNLAKNEVSGGMMNDDEDDEDDGFGDDDLFDETEGHTDEEDYRDDAEYFQDIQNQIDFYQHTLGQITTIPSTWIQKLNSLKTMITAIQREKPAGMFADVLQQYIVQRDIAQTNVTQTGGSLPANKIRGVINSSYIDDDKSPKGYMLDKELSDTRVKVYTDINSNQVLVVHRGSYGLKDWMDNGKYLVTGKIKSSDTYKAHKKKQQAAVDKYGASNIISIGHSRGGKYVEELNDDVPVKEVITYNKAIAPGDMFRRNPKNQTDIRSSRDVVSSLSPFQTHSNPVVVIQQDTLNPQKAHYTSSLSSLGNKLIGKGLKGGRFNPKSMRVGEMRKFIKAYKKEQGEKWTGGAKIGKKELLTIIKPMIAQHDLLQSQQQGSGAKKAWRRTKKGIDKGLSKTAEGLNMINPVYQALSYKPTAEVMEMMGNLSYHYAMPAMVSMGYYAYIAAAEGASTMLGFGPEPGRIAAELLWTEMVEKPGYDPRQNQKSTALGKLSGSTGKLMFGSGNPFGRDRVAPAPPPLPPLPPPPPAQDIFGDELNITQQIARIAVLNQLLNGTLASEASNHTMLTELYDKRDILVDEVNENIAMYGNDRSRPNLQYRIRNGKRRIANLDVLIRDLENEQDRLITILNDTQDELDELELEGKRSRP